MTRSTRLFDIIQILRSAPNPVTAATLARELEVTQRTIYRDMAALQAMRVPVEGEAGLGYIMRAGFDLPPLMFNAEELEALNVGLSLLVRTGDSGLERAARRAGEKISSAVNGAVPAAPLHSSGWHVIAHGPVSPEDARRFIRVAMELKIRYRNGEGRVTERAIKPIALIYYIEVIVLVAWCEWRGAIRNFRLDRIEDCDHTGRSFQEDVARLREQWHEASGLG
ncbi:MAG: YafY family protein [Pseudomonadota bacterium]